MASNMNSPQDVQTDEDIINLGDLFNTLWRGKIKILLWMLIFGGLGAFYALEVAVAKYRATTTILLDTTEQSLLDLGVSLPSLGSESEAINTEVEVLKSRRLTGQVASNAGLVEDEEFNETLKTPGLVDQLKERAFGPTPTLSERKIRTGVVNNLLDATTIVNVPSTYTLKITLETQDPEKSAFLADATANQYIQYKKDVKRELTEDSTKWLSGRVVDLKIDLEQAEAKVSDFTTRSKVISPEVITAYNLQLKEQRERLDAARNSLTAAQQKADRLAVVEDASPEEKVTASGSSALRRLYASEGVGLEFNRQFRQVVSDAVGQVARQDAQVAALEASVQDLEQRVTGQNQELIELQQLSREAEASRLLYEYFLSRLKENSAQEGIQQGEARILSNAEPPNDPSKPKKPLLVAMAGLFGLIFGCGLVLFTESRISTYRDPSDLEQGTGLPLLGQIPLIPVKKRRSVIDYLGEKPTSAPAEAVRNLRTSIVLSNVDKSPQVIMVTSSLPGEGKTTLSFALAQNYVGLGKKVLLIEGDIRRLVFSQYLKLKDPKGLMSVLSGESKLTDVVVADAKIGADILVSESTTVNAADLLSSNGFKKVLDQAREAYDYIIVDTPPVLVVPDARVVAQVVDAVVLVVAWDKTTRGQVRESIQMFRTVGINISGLILNQISIKGMRRYGYGDEYGAYGKYGSKYYTN